jgi:hypothetical protein
LVLSRPTEAICKKMFFSDFFVPGIPISNHIHASKSTEILQKVLFWVNLMFGNNFYCKFKNFLKKVFKNSKLLSQKIKSWKTRYWQIICEEVKNLVLSVFMLRKAYFLSRGSWLRPEPWTPRLRIRTILLRRTYQQTFVQNFSSLGAIPAEK